MRPLARLAAAAGTLATTAALGAAAPALAEPNQSATLSAAKPTFAWDGGPGNGVDPVGAFADRLGCNAVLDSCDTILLNVTQPASDVIVHVVGEGQNTVDIDLYLFFSDKDATQGDQIAASNGQSADEAVSSGEIDPGYYLAEVHFPTAVAGTYKGTAEFTPVTP